MRRRRPLTPEQLQEIAEEARRPLTVDGWTEATRTMPTDPAQNVPEKPRDDRR